VIKEVNTIQMKLLNFNDCGGGGGGGGGKTMIFMNNNKTHRTPSNKIR